MEDYNFLIERILFQALGLDLTVERVEMQGGGCINMSVKAVTSKGNFFVKWNELEFEDMFAKEAKGLAVLRGSNTLKIPEVLGIGQVEEKAFMVQEFLAQRPATSQDQTVLGEQLAAMHRMEGEEYGFHQSNFIGKLHQNNEPKSYWLTFFIQNRLNVQLGLAIYQEEVDQAFVNQMKQFLAKLKNMLPESPPSLVHGDLWNGNVMFTEEGPAIFDPAVYYGAREMDLAMTRLFGGFDAKFYEAYEANYPLPPHFDELVDVYNLYPLMVHVNLFGAHAGYLGKVKRIIKRYL